MQIESTGLVPRIRNALLAMDLRIFPQYKRCSGSLWKTVLPKQTQLACRDLHGRSSTRDGRGHSVGLRLRSVNGLKNPSAALDAIGKLWNDSVPYGNVRDRLVSVVREIFLANPDRTAAEREKWKEQVPGLNPVPAAAVPATVVPDRNNNTEARTWAPNTGTPDPGLEWRWFSLGITLLCIAVGFATGDSGVLGCRTTSDRFCCGFSR